MSVPPQLIRVKRKATEEAPVSYLRVQETKRHRSSVFVYQRQNEDVSFAGGVSKPTHAQKPVIHTSSRSHQATAPQSITKQDAHPDAEGSADAEGQNNDALDAAVSPVSEPRRFHMSRKDMLLAASPYTNQSHGGANKKRPAPAMFVEREIKRISPRVVGKLHAASESRTPTTETVLIGKPEPKKFKKPGVAKLSTAREEKPTDKPELPKSMTHRWNVDMQQLTADMEAYTMQQIGLNLQKAEDEKREQELREQELREQEKLRSSTPSKPKFKPKPTKRYAERHPEEVQSPKDREMVDAEAEAENSDSDDGDYIIETYVRVPASSIGAHVPPQSVGLLVFDAEPDVDFFYGEDDESEDEWAEDEEDENAENYYTADYPDEEVDTDDEFGANAYAFRTGNASDLEEYDVEDDSDESFNDESTTSQFRTYIGPNGLRSNHL